MRDSHNLNCVCKTDFWSKIYMSTIKNIFSTTSAYAINKTAFRWYQKLFIIRDLQIYMLFFHHHKYQFRITLKRNTARMQFIIYFNYLRSLLVVSFQSVTEQYCSRLPFKLDYTFVHFVLDNKML